MKVNRYLRALADFYSMQTERSSNKALTHAHESLLWAT